MREVILDKPRRRTADIIGTVLILGWAIGFGIGPVFALLHPQYVASLEWFIMAPLALVSLLATSIVVWRVFGRELIVLDAGALRVHYTAGFFHRSLSLPLTRMTEVRIVSPGRSERPNVLFGIGHRSVFVQNAAGRLCCGMALANREAEGLAHVIREASIASVTVEQSGEADRASRP